MLFPYNLHRRVLSFLPEREGTAPLPASTVSYGIIIKYSRVIVSFFSFTVDILLKAVGDTPIMKTKKWAVERTRTIQGLIDFIKKFLKLVASEQLFIYVNQSFAPSPDQEVGTLYECFGSDGKLVLHYCKSQAWG
ncbi:PREDICTED: ubiquitin-like protein ATG12 [Dipodomys ordii]|uniref:Ubiquitin-like protein ATG12 n=1 Tax=Dipodomys ordii TaxID=10020 RepID=A0A1S3F6L5_DIPOR|nr:PREDICTED: ubiquitin-like protein ATG12 [Dipodomys ordii]